MAWRSELAQVHFTIDGCRGRHPARGRAASRGKRRVVASLGELHEAAGISDLLEHPVVAIRALVMLAAVAQALEPARPLGSPYDRALDGQRPQTPCSGKLSICRLTNAMNWSAVAPSMMRWSKESEK